MLVLLYLVALCNKDVMNLFKTTTTISEPKSLPNEDKKKRNYNNIFN